MADIEDLMPIMRVWPRFLFLSIASKMVDLSCTTMALESATMKSLHLNFEVPSGSLSWAALTGILFEKEILLMVDRLSSFSNQATA